jgi:hypothetical protein
MGQCAAVGVFDAVRAVPLCLVAKLVHCHAILVGTTRGATGCGDADSAAHAVPVRKALNAPACRVITDAIDRAVARVGARRVAVTRPLGARSRGRAVRVRATLDADLPTRVAQASRSDARLVTRTKHDTTRARCTRSPSAPTLAGAARTRACIAARRNARCAAPQPRARCADSRPHDQRPPKDMLSHRWSITRSSPAETAVGVTLRNPLPAPHAWSCALVSPCQNTACPALVRGSAAGEGRSGCGRRSENQSHGMRVTA